MNALLASRKVHSVLEFIVSLCPLTVFLELHFQKRSSTEPFLLMAGEGGAGTSIAERQRLAQGAWQREPLWKCGLQSLF